MMILAGGTKFSLSYTELRTHYQNFCTMSDDDFLSNILDALHLAVVICYFKETPHEYSLGERGIVHELVHIMKDAHTRPLNEIREDFEEILKLA